MVYATFKFLERPSSWSAASCSPRYRRPTSGQSRDAQVLALLAIVGHRHSMLRGDRAVIADEWRLVYQAVAVAA